MAASSPSSRATSRLSRKFSTSPTHAITRTDKAGNKKSLVRKEIGDTAYLVTAQRGKGKLEVKTMRKAHRSGASC